MFSCLGSKRNTRNCVVNPQSRTRTVDLSESRKRHEELKKELINLRQTRKNSKTGKDRLREITQQNIKKLAVIRRLKTLQKKSRKKRILRKIASDRRRSGKKKRTKRKKSTRGRRRRTKINTNESKQESTMGGRRRKRKSRRRRRY